MKKTVKTNQVDFPLQLYLKNLYQQYQDINNGEVANYIPELQKANPNAFGISLMTTDGVIQEIGDTSCKFTIQSLSKPFVYGLILADLGIEQVLKKIDVEPSGDAFNSISLEPKTGRPLNPMINAGAIAATSCVKGKNIKKRLERILATLSCYAGRELSIDEKVYKSEQKTGHRNRALAHMLRNFNIIERDIDAALNLYFQQCSILVSSHDLAIMAATLANDGINPITGKRAISSDFVPLILSVMSLCGMYDYSGRWIYDVGLPAKSGISGGIIAVLPGQFGLSIYSPRLDSRGNSVKGTLVCKQFSQDFGLHLLRIPKIALSVIRASYNLRQFRSKRAHNLHDNQLLDNAGDRANVFELQGEMRFATAEAAVLCIYTTALNSDYVIVDFKKVPNVDLGACRLLESLIIQLMKINCHLIFAGHNKLLFNSSESLIQQLTKINHFNDLDNALEWAEAQLIKSISSHYHLMRVEFVDNDMCCGMSLQQRTILIDNTDKIMYQPGEIITNVIDIPDKVFFIIQGEVSVYLPVKKNNHGNRITTLSAGMFFGELALLAGTKRIENVIADTVVECQVLSIKTLNALCEVDNALKIKLLENLAKNLVNSLIKSNLEVVALKY
jgi:glutaminase